MMRREWVLRELERLGIIRIAESRESKYQQSEALVTRVKLTENFESRLAWNLTQEIQRKNPDYFRKAVVMTVKEMASFTEISLHVKAVFRILKAKGVDQSTVENILRSAGASREAS